MREQNTKDVKKEFLTTAFDYLVKHGLENTSVRDLCKETKISYGSIYYWFDGKDDIYINATKYGISKVAEALFDYAFEAMKDMKSFCDGFLDEVDKYKDEFRLILQVTSSPVYGDTIRSKAEDFNPIYKAHTEHMSEMFSLDLEDMLPMIYLLISILVDYVVWNDRASSQMQLNFLYKIFTKIPTK
ncbi:MAG: TetR/AcrR family transcriptional regulator [Clostridia bacterium]|nr:TetR/AcrR family transcriptional regulator [Clostridia bacterium]